MRVAPRHGLDDAGDFDHGLSGIEDTRLTVMRVSKVPEHGETQNHAHDREELSHVVISCRALCGGLKSLHPRRLDGARPGSLEVMS